MVALAYMKWFTEGSRHFEAAEYDQAIDCWKEALEIGKQEKIEQVISKSLMNIATAYSSKGDWKQALEYYYSSLEIEKKRGEISSIAENLMGIGDALFALKKREDACNYYKQFLEIYKQRDQNRARVLLNLGLNSFSEGNWKEAMGYYEECLELFQDLKDPEGLSKALANLGIVARNLGEWEKAIQYYTRSYEIDLQLQDKQGMGICLMNMAIALEAVGKIKEAIENYQSSLSIFRELGDEKSTSICLLNLGNAFAVLKKWDMALEFYQQSINLFEKIGDQPNISKSLTNMGIALRNLGRWEDAIQNYQTSLQEFEKSNDQVAISKCLLDLGVAYYSINQLEEALNNFHRSQKLFQKYGDRPGEAIACQNLGLTYYKRKDFRRALKYFNESLGIYTTLATQLESEEYRDSYMREFAELPKIIETLSQIVEQQSVEIKRFSPVKTEEYKDLDEVLIQLRDNIIELNASMKDQSAFPGLSKNISNFTSLVQKLLETASLTEKLRREKISGKILDSLEICNSLFKVFRICEPKAMKDQVVSYLRQLDDQLQHKFPHFTISEEIQNIITRLREEPETFISEALLFNLKFVILHWTKQLLTIINANKKVYLEDIGKFDENTIQLLESELNTKIEHLIDEETEYSKQILGHLIVIMKNSGIPVYKKDFIETAWDGDLISGFLTAIQSFGNEFSQERTSMEMLAYKNLKIHFQDGEIIRCALILKGEITDLLTKTLKSFLYDFETTYQTALIQYTGDVGPFKQATKLIDRYFGFRSNLH